MSSPIDVSELSPQPALLLEGSAHDPEEGALTGSALSCWSDRDGLLGRGDTALVPGLTLSWGEHTLTLKATDGDRQIGEASVTVVVVGHRVYLPAVLRSAE